ncbi:MAG: SDR family NAD(P)-dependent oxidoreductase [Gemmatimonadaceae bacterium]
MEDKVIVITGASAGIGAALAELAASRGASVVLAARREKELDDVRQRCGDKAFAVVADMTKREEARGVVAGAIARFDHIDVWVNNVGQGITKVPSLLTDDDIDEMIRLNVKTAFYGMQEVLPHFIQRGEGHVINISSMLGRIPMATFRAAYSASKHFLNALTTNFRMEVQEQHPNIQFSIVSPPVVRTEFGKNALHGGPDSRELPNSQDAGEVAEVIAGVIESRKADVYSREGSHDWVVKYYDELGVDR